MTLLSTTSLSGSSTTVSSISGTYTNLWLNIYGVYGSNDRVSLKVGMNADTDEHDYSGLISETSAGIVLDLIWNDDSFNIGYMDDTSTSTMLFSASCILYNYASANYKSFASGSYVRNSSASKIISTQLYGRYRGAAVSSIKFFPSAGTFTAGTVEIWGIK
jgi:hypothetical protein